MDKKSDFAIREHIKIAKSELLDLIKQFKWLDEADKILMKIQNIKDIEAAINAYIEKLKILLKENLGDSVMYAVGEEAFKDVIKKLKKYLETGKLKIDYARQSEIIRDALQSLSHHEESAVEIMRKNLRSKVANFSLLVKQKLNQIKSAIDTAGRAVVERTFDVKIENEKDLLKYWRLLTKRYGSLDKVVYADGKQFPITSYLDMRARTNSELVHSAVTEAIAVGSEIYFGKISAHNTQDSCIYWENKIIFYNQVLKEAFIRRYPELTDLVRNYATLDDVRNDRTHMFSYNCRHTILPYPLHLFDYNEMVNELKQNKMPVIPKKIPLRFSRAS